MRISRRSRRDVKTGAIGLRQRSGYRAPLGGGSAESKAAVSSGYTSFARPALLEAGLAQLIPEDRVCGRGFPPSGKRKSDRDQKLMVSHGCAKALIVDDDAFYCMAFLSEWVDVTWAKDRAGAEEGELNRLEEEQFAKAGDLAST